MDSLPSLPDRRCLVCGGPTTSCHYGVEVCRACTVFYRKACKKPLYACRRSTRSCAVTSAGSTACKRCRFDRFKRILLESGRDQPGEEEPIDPSGLNDPGDQRDRPAEVVAIPEHQQIVAAKTPRPLLEKCAICYKMMCAMRRNSELNAHPNPPHPSKINAGEYEIIPSTFGIMNGATRFLLTGILDFAETMFPEFSTFSREDQWQLASSVHGRIYVIDGAYRAEKVYPDDPGKTLAAYTSYMSEDVVENFFVDCPSEDANFEDAKRELRKYVSEHLPSSRLTIRRANLDDVELHAILILSFWFIDCMQMREDIVQIAEKYRQEVLRELTTHYTEDLKLEDYAARIGELFMLIFSLNFGTNEEEQFELYRLLGVFTDDTFVYRMKDRSD